MVRKTTIYECDICNKTVKSDTCHIFNLIIYKKDSKVLEKEIVLCGKHYNLILNIIRKHKNKERKHGYNFIKGNARGNMLKYFTEEKSVNEIS